MALSTYQRHHSHIDFPQHTFLGCWVNVVQDITTGLDDLAIVGDGLRLRNLSHCVGVSEAQDPW
jgi:hypothetical protein